MSWDRTYSHNVLIALDSFAAALVFNRPDLTISTMCDMVRNPMGRHVLKLSTWQLWSLQRLGPILDWIQKGHCKLARQGDIDRANSTLESLNAPRT